MTDIAATENTSGIPIEKQNTPVPEIQEKKTSNLWEKVKKKIPFWKNEVNEKPDEVITEISEITDQEKQPVNQENKDGGQLHVEGLPEGIKLAGFGHAQEELDWVIESKRWNLNVTNDGEGKSWLNMSPKVVEGVNEVGDGKLVDTRIAQVDPNGYVTVKPESGYKYCSKTEKNLVPEEGIIYRGMSKEELDMILSTGEISSRGDVVDQSDTHRGLTFFSKDPNESLGYGMSQVMPGYRSPTFEVCNYLISIEKPENNGFLEGMSAIAYDVPISSEKIQRVYEIRPISITEGKMYLTKYSEDMMVLADDWLSQSVNGPKTEFAIKDVTKDFFPDKN